MGLGLHNYHDTLRAFPAAATSAPAGGFGYSWSVALLPFMEQTALYDQLDLYGGGNGAIGIVYSGYNDHNGTVVAGLYIKYLFCPSSPLPKWMHTDKPIPGPKGVLWSTYTAITGSYDHPSRTDAYCIGQMIGWKSTGGAMTPLKWKTFAAVTDGTSNTMVIGEQSDFCKDSGGAKQDCRSDWGHGFLAGTQPAGEIWSFNYTSVKYNINTKAYNQTGIEGPVPASRPIQSAHPSGAHVLLADGSVRLLSQSMDLKTLYNLADCDDGNALNDF